jgi:hypothetical protein
MTYRYRGLPFSVVKHPWFVAGVDYENGSGGILEWCVDEEDAQTVLQQMQACGTRFGNLSIGCDEGEK